MKRTVTMTTMNSNISSSNDNDVEAAEPLTSFQRSWSVLSLTPSNQDLYSSDNSTDNNKDKRRINGVDVGVITELVIGIFIFFLGYYVPRKLLHVHDEDGTLLLGAYNNDPPPYQMTAAGDVLLDLKLNQPLIDPQTIPSLLLKWTSIWIPMVFVAIVSWWCTRTTTEKGHSAASAAAATAVSSFLTCIGISEFCTQCLKILVQRKRPNFYALCGFDFSTKTCLGTMINIREAQFSFPSGHSSMVSCSMTFLTFFLVAKLVHSKRIGLRQKRISCFFTCLLLWGYAILVGTTRLMDHWHHPSDVLAGLLLGGFTAIIVYHVYYPPIWMSSVAWSLHKQ